REMPPYPISFSVSTIPSIGAIGVDETEKLIGYGGISLRTSAEIMTVGVARAAQNRGIGRALMRALLAQAHRHESDEVFLEVRVDNAAAISLYRSLGFADVRIRRGYYQPENIDALVMRRK
ncbi:MAG TPA: ribosomal protein S18-alanine N-acetyltransferase, partial [Actinomycetales bacterium]|nr:ribosomal protein S18-alanine N-acetyltransferase [Actinomycetales bacterium]